MLFKGSSGLALVTEKKPCVRSTQDADTKDFIFKFTQLLTRENVKTQTIQKSYTEGLGLYFKNISKPQFKSERLCVLMTLLALFETPRGTATPEILAEWYSTKLTTIKLETQFKVDLSTIKDNSDPKDFAEQVVAKLLSYNPGDQ